MTSPSRVSKHVICADIRSRDRIGPGLVHAPTCVTLNLVRKILPFLRSMVGKYCTSTQQNIIHLKNDLYIWCKGTFWWVETDENQIPIFSVSRGQPAELTSAEQHRTVETSPEQPVRYRWNAESGWETAESQSSCWMYASFASTNRIGVLNL